VASVLHWVDGELCCNEAWESAYRRFESAEQEIKKFRRRLLVAGAAKWPKDSRVLDLFCGAGNGLKALEQLGFTRLTGVDLSPRLVAQYRGPAQLYVGDCRDLKLPDASCDVVIVQGGLHHLPSLPGDLERVMAEARRVLVPSGRIVLVEPWDTPFLRVVHAACESRALCALWSKLDALATMIEHERTTYMSWLAAGESNLQVIRAHFEPTRCSEAFGKLLFVGRPRLSGYARPQ
jgi:SAM-dependent methyltransferase